MKELVIAVPLSSVSVVCSIEAAACPQQTCPHQSPGDVEDLRQFGMGAFLPTSETEYLLIGCGEGRSGFPSPANIVSSFGGSFDRINTGRLLTGRLLD